MHPEDSISKLLLTSHMAKEECKGSRISKAQCKQTLLHVEEKNTAHSSRLLLSAASSSSRLNPNQIFELNYNANQDGQAERIGVKSEGGKCDDDASRTCNSGSSVQFVMSQSAVNSEIVAMVEESTINLTFISMMSQHSDPALVKSIKDAISRGVNVAVYHSANPYVPLPDDGELPEYVQVIPMHGTKIWNVVSTLLGTFVDPMHSNVTHSRFIVNDTHAMFGGVDFNKVCESESYIQNAIKLSFEDPHNGFVKKDLNGILNHLRTSASLHEYEYSLCLDGSFVGTSTVCNSALRLITEIINRAQKLIFIENQYLQHREVLSAIAKRQKEKPNLEIILVGNTDFEINPYHPGKCYRVLSSYANYVFRKETRLGLDMLLKSGCSYQYRTYQEKYTHNKVFIADDVLVVGTFNLHERSLELGNDIETGIVLKNQESLIDTYVKTTLEATIALLWS